jgi:hypothetical protein
MNLDMLQEKTQKIYLDTVQVGRSKEKGKSAILGL